MRRTQRVMMALVLVLAAAPAVRGQQAPAQPSSAETAKSIAARWKKLLDLSAEQTMQFENLAYAIEKKTADAKTAAGGDPAKLEADMTAIYKERQEAVAKILTPDQLKRYEALMARARRKAAQKAAETPAKPPA